MNVQLLKLEYLQERLVGTWARYRMGWMNSVKAQEDPQSKVLLMVNGRLSSLTREVHGCGT